MIIKASQRGCGAALAAHLMNGHDNEHVEIHRIQGFMGETIHEAFEEIEALSKATRCQQYLFSVSLSPPPDQKASTKIFDRAIEKIAKKNGLENQPHIVVFHEKQGRRHAHCVWSRIDIEHLRAINLPFFKNKLMEIGKAIYLEQGWRLPEGHIDRSNSNPLNFTLAEWQQAKRQKRAPKQIKQEIRQLWTQARSKAHFEKIMNARGYYLACGEPRRSFVFVDWAGQVRSLSRHTGAKTKELTVRLGKAQDFPKVDTVREQVNQKLAANIEQNVTKLRAQHEASIAPLNARKAAMTQAHQRAREKLKARQEAELHRQRQAQQKSLARGIRGLWQRFTGERLRLTRKHEQEALRLYQRNRQAMDDVIFRQLEERQALQREFDAVEQQYEQKLEQFINTMQVQVAQKQSLTAQQITKSFEDLGLPFNGYGLER